MPIENNLQTITLDGWIFRVRPPQTAPPPGAIPPIVLQIHGWTGDETVMWIFTRRIPDEFAVLSPRGPYPVPSGGYAWLPGGGSLQSTIEDFRPAAGMLLGRVTQWVDEHYPTRAGPLRPVPLRLVGFSQGAAMAYSLALLAPAHVERAAALAGFLPHGAERLLKDGAAAGKPIYIAHGSRDELVPVQRARQAAEALQAAGADVRYCESDVGHKLSLDCFQELEEFLTAAI